ncbi:GntR family transcriptional regulator [Actinoallomurus sp. NBC_01490]|uniref:GntR family transcriptional regulator n=1 Tax=Actinoallomurus sp. NBC_01490 TaxID=2903557 RepID=UPI002E32A710|nr:GntR family transcriptional regulator [Actinoallomurus sp. NBC_01490]
MAGATSPSGDESTTGAKKEPSLWETVRDQLIAEIESGAYPAGALLPSVRELTAKLTVSTTTARKALAELVSAGYARSEGTRGHVSEGPNAGRVDVPPAALDVGPRAGTHAVSGTVIVRTAVRIPVDGAVPGQPPGIDVRSEAAPAEVALALRLPDPTVPLIVRRRLTVDAHGVPSQLRVSYIAPAFVEGTRLAEPDLIEESWQSALAHARELDVKVIESYVTARHPNDAEAAMLGLTPTSCVLVRVDVTQATGPLDGQEGTRPIDYTITVWPADNTRLDLEIRQ